MHNLTSKTVCFTGHRKIPVLKSISLKRKLKKTIEQRIAEGFCCFCAGGALGFDTLAAQTVLELKKQYPNIELILVLPCESQTLGWKEKDIEIYEDIKRQADEVVYTAKEYTRGCMHKRNRYLVDHSSACIAYLTESTGGTAYTVDYAIKHGLSVCNIADDL